MSASLITTAVLLVLVLVGLALKFPAVEGASDCPQPCVSNQRVVEKCSLCGYDRDNLEETNAELRGRLATAGEQVMYWKGVANNLRQQIAEMEAHHE